MTAPVDRRIAVEDALMECPVGRWMRFDDFSQFMYVKPFDFSVTHDPWRLYIGDSRHGSLGYAGYHDWDILHGRYVMCLLFEYAATLGMIDVAYTHPDGARLDFTGIGGADELVFLSRYDGLRYFRINPLGAWCLDMADEYVPAAPPPTGSVTVYPDLRTRWNGERHLTVYAGKADAFRRAIHALGYGMPHG